MYYKEKNYLMEYDKSKILVKELPASIIIKNFIEGHPADCEEFMTDFINSSKLVKEKGDEKFILRKHQEQSQGELDIYNSFYELDFKILVDSKYMEAKSILSNSLSEICTGVILESTSKVQGSRRAIDILRFFRSITIEDLQNIEKGTLKFSDRRLIKQILKKMSVNKNILFFLPYDYFFETIETDENSLQFIIDCIGEDLKSLIRYRKTKTNQDTYISFISNNYFVIALENNNKIIFYDMIRTDRSSLYNYLFNICRF